MASVLTVLNIERREAKLVGFVFLQSFLLGLPQLFTAASAGALFLTSYGAGKLPYAYLGSALVLPLIGLGILGLQKRRSDTQVLRVIFLLLIAGLASLYLLASFSRDEKFPRLLLLIWVDIEYTLTEMAFWLQANALFNVRQAKRLFGFLGVGQVTAAVAGGILLPALAPLLGIGNMYLFSLAGLILAFANSFYLNETFGCTGERAARKDPSAPGRPDLFPETELARPAAQDHRPYIVLIFSLVMLEYLSHYLLDLLFYGKAGENIAGASGLASFLALFLAASGVSKILMKTFVSARWMKRFGVGGSLAAPALAVALPAAAALGGEWILRAAGSPTAVFGFVCLTAARGAETLFVSSIYAPAYFTLYQPLDAGSRSQAQNIADTVVGQVSGGVAGLFILGLTRLTRSGGRTGGRPLTDAVMVLLLLLLGIWFSVARSAGKRFRSKVAENLVRRGIEGSRRVAVSAEAVPVLRHGLGSPHPGVAVYALQKLAEAGEEGLEPHRARFLGHPDDRVRDLAERLTTGLPPGARLGAESAAGNADPLRGRRSGTPSRGRTDSAQDWEEAFRRILEPGSRNSAMRKFEDGMEEAVDFLEGKYREEGLPGEGKTLIIRLLAVMRNPKAEDLLLALWNEADRNLFHQVLHALFRRRFRLPPSHFQALDKSLENELALGKEMLHTARRLAPYPGLPFIHEALREELGKAEERIFLLLTFAYPPREIIAIWNSLSEAGEAGKAFALDLLESTLSPEHRGRILPFLETDRRTRPGEPGFPSRGDLHAFLETVRRRADALGFRWLAASALHALYVEQAPLDPEKRRAAERDLPLIERVTSLRDAPIFRNIPDENLFEFAPAMRLIAYGAGERIISRNEQGSTMYIIRAGSVRVHDDERDITSFGEGDIFGEFSALSPEPRSAHITAVTPVQAFEITGAELYAFMERKLRTARAVLRVLSSRIRSTLERACGNAPAGDAAPPTSGPPRRESGAERPLTAAYSALEIVMTMKSFDLFLEIPEEILLELAEHMTERTVPAGSALYEAGSGNGNLYLVHQGRIEALRNGSVVSSAGPGWIVGEIEAVDYGPPPLEARAVEPATVWIMERSLLGELMWDRFSVIRSLILTFIERLRALTRR